MAALVVFTCVLFSSPPGMAVEPYVGLFVGAAIPQDSDIELSAPGTIAGTGAPGSPFLDTRRPGHLEWIEVAISLRWRT